MAAALLSAIQDTLITGLIIAVMMVLVELVNVRLRGRLPKMLGQGGVGGYLLAASLGVLPGCAGGYLAVTLYGHRALTFGAVVSAMVATSGDEAFVMLGQFPRTALALLLSMFVLGTIVGALTDLVGSRLGMANRRDCETVAYHPGDEDVAHFFREHVLEHVLLRHLPRILLWTFPALLLSASAAALWTDGRPPISFPLPVLVALGAVWGLIPSSGPHLIFVELFAKGLIPISVLASNSLSQTGHDILPLLAVSWRDAVVVKVICLATALGFGLALIAVGL